MTYKAYYYLKSSGRAPLEEYFKTIRNFNTLIAIKTLIDRLIGTECNLPPPFIKPVTRKIYELRLAQFSNQYRVFYFIITRGKIVLLDGYTKKSNRIPKNILKRVTQYYCDYLINYYEKEYE